MIHAHCSVDSGSDSLLVPTAFSAHAQVNRPLFAESVVASGQSDCRDGLRDGVDSFRGEQVDVHRSAQHGAWCTMGLQAKSSRRCCWIAGMTNEINVALDRCQLGGAPTRRQHGEAQSGKALSHASDREIVWTVERMSSVLH